ncbi:MAG: flavodoxin family protein [archaeon]|nr:flavodoxin family protein [archaeon]
MFFTMKAMVLCGSGNTDGYTHDMCQTFADGLKPVFSEVRVVDLSSLRIGDCTGCSSCRYGRGCVLRDDAEALFREMEDTDLLVLATPIRFNGPSSVLKRFIDRLNPYWGGSRVHPRWCCGLMCAGSSRPCFDHARSEMRSASNTVGMEWLGELCIPDTDHGKGCGPETKRFVEEILKRISG